MESVLAEGDKPLPVITSKKREYGILGEKDDKHLPAIDVPGSAGPSRTTLFFQKNTDLGEKDDKLLPAIVPPGSAGPSRTIPAATIPGSCCLHVTGIIR